MRGWAAVVGLQIEHSLLERSVEQELVPMARQFGLGITPWSPLKSGALSGKYTRATVGQVKADRGPFLEPFLNNEKTFMRSNSVVRTAKAAVQISLRRPAAPPASTRRPRSHSDCWSDERDL